MAYSSTLFTSVWNCSSVRCTADWLDRSSLIRMAARATLHLNRSALHIRFPRFSLIAGKSRSSTPTIQKDLLRDMIASGWLCEVKRRSDRHDSCRINVSVRHVVMALDVIEIDRVGNAGLLI